MYIMLNLEFNDNPFYTKNESKRLGCLMGADDVSVFI